MKKLLFFLLLIPALLNAQSWVQYYPKNGLRDAVAVILPDNYDPAKKCKWEIAVHGIGERSAGTLANLENLVLGPDYNGDGIRDGAPFVTADMKKAVNQYGIVLFVPTYGDFFEPEKINRIYDFAHANYSLTQKFFLTGFSYGGGATLKYITSSTANAGKVTYAVPVAPTSNIVDASIPGKAGLPVHIFVNDKDDNGPTNISVTRSVVDAINRSNPAIKAIYTAFRQNGHGGNIEAWSLNPPKAPGGQGFIDANENIYQVYSDIVATGIARQMKGGAVTPTPDPIPTPAGDPVANLNLTDTDTIYKEVFQADASASLNVRADWQGYAWDVKPITGSWGAGPEGGMYGGPLKKITGLKDGTYTIGLTVTNKDGKTNKKSVNVIVKITATLPTKYAIGFDSATDLIYYSDGSNEKGTASYSGGKWLVKTASGTVVQF